MATKYLARTVIEGGRRPHNCWERRRSNALERRWATQTSGRLIATLDPEAVLYRARPKVYAEFRDKLGPAERWLAAQIGKPWNDVRSELAQRFDTRTTAGRHILYDHLLPSVESHERALLPAKFIVDAAGILRRAPHRRRPRYRHTSLYEPSEDVRAWIAGRRVGRRGDVFYWFLQTNTGAFRQHLRLTPAEVARFLALPESYRKQCDAFRAADLVSGAIPSGR